MSRCIGCVLMVFVFQVWAQTDGLQCVFPAYLGHLPTEESISKVVVCDGYVYLAVQDEGLAIVDDSDQLHPTIVSTLVLGGAVDDVYIDGDLAIVLVQQVGVVVVDISDPTAPAELSRYEDPHSRTMDYSDGHVFLIDRMGLLRCISISVNGLLDVVGSYDVESWSINTQAIGSSFFYERAGDLHHIDFSDPGDPAVEGPVGYGDSVCDFRIENDQLCLLRESSLEQYDISSFVLPVLLDGADISGTDCSGIVVSGGLTCVIQPSFGFAVYEFDAATGFRLVSQMNVPGVPRSVFIQGSVVYCGTSRYGLQLISVESEYRSPLIREFDLPADSVSSVYSYGDLLILTTYDSKLLLYRLLQGGEWEHVGTLDTNPSVQSAAVEGDYLYLSSSPSLVYSFHDPMNAKLVATMETDAHELIVRDDVCYVADDRFGRFFSAWDVSDPTSPVMLSEVHLSLPKRAFGLRERDGYVFMALQSDGLAVVDARDPTDVEVIYDEFGQDIYARDIEMIWPLVYVSSGGSGMRVYDVSDPHHPELVHVITNVLGQPNIIGDTLYTQAPYGLVGVYDISDLNNVELVGQYGLVGRNGVASSVSEVVWLNGSLYVFQHRDTRVAVLDPEGCGSCPADLNDDGALNFYDVSSFLVGYLSNDPVSDWNDDGAFDFFDVSGFLVDYQGGCP